MIVGQLSPCKSDSILFSLLAGTLDEAAFLLVVCRSPTARQGSPHCGRTVGLHEHPRSLLRILESRASGTRLIALVLLGPLLRFDVCNTTRFPTMLSRRCR